MDGMGYVFVDLPEMVRGFVVISWFRSLANHQLILGKYKPSVHRVSYFFLVVT